MTPSGTAQQLAIRFPSVPHGRYVGATAIVIDQETEPVSSPCRGIHEARPDAAGQRRRRKGLPTRSRAARGRSARTYAARANRPRTRSQECPFVSYCPSEWSVDLQSATTLDRRVAHHEGMGLQKHVRSAAFTPPAHDRFPDGSHPAQAAHGSTGRARPWHRLPRAWRHATGSTRGETRARPAKAQA